MKDKDIRARLVAACPKIPGHFLHRIVQKLRGVELTESSIRNIARAFLRHNATNYESYFSEQAQPVARYSGGNRQFQADANRLVRLKFGI